MGQKKYSSMRSRIIDSQRIFCLVVVKIHAKRPEALFLGPQNLALTSKRGNERNSGQEVISTTLLCTRQYLFRLGLVRTRRFEAFKLQYVGKTKEISVRLRGGKKG